METQDFRWDIAWAAQTACILEADAPKVGNVNRLHDFADCSLEDFHLSAVAIGKPLGQIQALGVGRAILNAIKATRQTVPSNTNLGIVLLLAPLAMGWSQMTKSSQSKQPWNGAHELGTSVMGTPVMRTQVMGKVLRSLTIQDTRDVYEAIRIATPSGMGKVENHDVYEEEAPNISLLQAMKMAADRDLIARQYSTDFELVLHGGVPNLEGNLKKGLSLPQAIAQTHLYLLSEHPDSLIVRKNGLETGEQIMTRAKRVYEKGGWLTPAGQQAVKEFDQELRAEGHKLNPGTMADLIAATLFVFLLFNPPGTRST